MTREAELAAALDRLRTRLAAACESAQRDPADVTLLPVTKFFPASDVEILYRLGCRAFGESREQEASAKVAALHTREPVAWHMIGRLQRNKSRAVAKWAHTVHSVDSARLAAALDRAAGEVRDAPLRVLLQVSLDTDTQRGGVAANDLAALADQVDDSPNLQLSGVMAIPPLDADPDRAFARLAELHDDLRRAHPHATELSAGMSNDLEIAVRHGSTCVRVGTALMGPRPLISH